MSYDLSKLHAINEGAQAEAYKARKAAEKKAEKDVEIKREENRYGRTEHPFLKGHVAYTKDPGDKDPNTDNDEDYKRYEKAHDIITKNSKKYEDKFEDATNKMDDNRRIIEEEEYKKDHPMRSKITGKGSYDKNRHDDAVNKTGKLYDDYKKAADDLESHRYNPVVRDATNRHLRRHPQNESVDDCDFDMLLEDDWA